MYYERFEDLPVWNDAIGLAVRLLEVSEAGHLGGVGDLKSQLERAAISISNNIAEGFDTWHQCRAIELPLHRQGLGGRGAVDAPLARQAAEGPRAGAPGRRPPGPRREHLPAARALDRVAQGLAYQGKKYQNARTRQAAEAVKKRDRLLEEIRRIQDEAIRGRGASLDGSAPPPGGGAGPGDRDEGVDG